MYGFDPTVTDHVLTAHCGAVPAKDFTDAEDRVTRVLEMLSPGEQALVYLMLYNLGQRIDQAREAVRKMKKDLPA